MDLALRTCFLGAENIVSRDPTEKELEQPYSELMLWTGFLLPPLAWSIGLEVLYLFSDYGCETTNFIPNHIVSAVALILSLLGGFIAWRCWQTSGAEWPGEGNGPIPRSQFMSALGLLTSALFSALIIAQWLPTVLGVPCGK